MKLIDIHCHLIPGIDDGSKNKEETMEMLELMREQGVVGVIATPHYRVGMFEPEMEEVEKRFHWSMKAARHHKIHLWLGNECHMQNDTISRLVEKKCITLANSRYILVEFSSAHSYNVIRQYIMDLLMEGYIPVIAHLERIPSLEEQWSSIQELRELGAKVQVNAEGILGESGRKMKRYLWKLIQRDMIDYIASDSHNMNTRRPNLGPCYELVAKKINEEYANKVFYENQKKIIYNVRG